MMKKLLFMACLAMLTLSACDKEEPDGEWPPIILSENPLEVPAEGGTVKTSVRNYASLWLIGAYRDGKRLPVQMGDEEGTPDPYNIKSEYITAHSEGKNVTITVVPSEDGKAHVYHIEIEHGDSFGTITINQLAARN